MDNFRRQQRQVQNENGVSVNQTTVTGSIPVAAMAEAKIVPGVVAVPTKPSIPKPPMNMQKLMQLDETELKEMEGKEKQAIARRIQHLRQIRTMCDATITMMDQYDSLDIHSSIGVEAQTQTEILDKDAENKTHPLSERSPKESDPNELRRRRVQAFSNLEDTLD